MNYNSGFSLLSVLVYILCSSILVLCIFHTISQFFVPSIQAMITHKKQIDLHIMVDLFIKDIRKHPVIAWKNNTKHELQWKNDAGDICWIFKSGSLKRVQGTYKKKKRHKQTTSMVGANLKDVNFHYDYDQGKIIGIEIVLTGSSSLNKRVSGYVAIRNES